MAVAARAFWLCNTLAIALLIMMQHALTALRGPPR